MVRDFWKLLCITSVVTTIHAAESPYHNSLIEPACNTATSIFMPWTGFRVSRQTATRTRPWETVYEMRISYCWRGSEYFVTTISTGGGWIAWNSTFCIEETPYTSEIAGCFKLARRMRYSSIDSPLYHPDTFVGGLFLCESETLCTNYGAVPISPMITDQPYMVWYENSPNHTEVIPLLYTPDRSSVFYPRVNSEWASYIDINEEYDPDARLIDDNTSFNKTPKLTPRQFYLSAIKRVISQLRRSGISLGFPMAHIVKDWTLVIDQLLLAIFKMPPKDAAYYYRVAVNTFEQNYICNFTKFQLF
ncbi:hypothetical protein AWJ20_3022 [Sugiyamaella lignohabitans]|uniref:Uncharacterized protein n=1 Tax=Sugiyamaella lignohabitans TaxID=796027 RepID=A0A167FJW9_9ASCO|nr:uncharacterized protein AWJ20_3022 [Sugiyamaella lignohabitans]ANB15395.1 hypothetical protein AWJ20_3022 [Sugiyamaella lignohabitans]